MLWLGILMLIFTITNAMLGTMNLAKKMVAVGWLGVSSALVCAVVASVAFIQVGWGTPAPIERLSEKETYDVLGVSSSGGSTWVLVLRPEGGATIAVRADTAASLPPSDAKRVIWRNGEFLALQTP